ncbi:mitochondrial uncoupling protein 1-like [Strongylocentrotus purpuratus]|uniref:Uncharacterized protein n=1 Tax=Strongylocentrotus purpuratus TaxID=7668 RepID=A0A7M7N0Q6_STRPU|nr:mitochondrial uncoupling protein 1-like [Strongylocentrotus purpuratus]
MTDWKETGLRYAAAGTSCMCASCCTNPIEVTKVRIQLEGELIQQSAVTAYRQRYYKGLLRGLVTVARDEGIRGLYKGLIPSLIREAIYSTLRFGSYEPIKKLYGAKDPTRTPLSIKLAAGATAGALGSWFANPMDIVRIRLQGDGQPLPGQQPRYPPMITQSTLYSTTAG